MPTDEVANHCVNGANYFSYFLSPLSLQSRHPSSSAPSMRYDKFTNSLDTFPPSVVRFILKTRILTSVSIAALTQIPIERVRAIRDGLSSPTNDEARSIREVLSINEDTFNRMLEAIREWRKIRVGAMIRPTCPNSRGTPRPS